MHELILDVNKRLIAGEAFTEQEKQKITQELLSKISSPETVTRFHTGVKAPDDGRNMYPKFYITPYNNGKKLRLITGELPKTHILAANHYELEILRVLALFDRDNQQVKNMIDETLKRIDKTCYGHFCSAGECVGAGIAVIRFLSVLPGKEAWINKILTPTIKLYGANNLPVYYLCSAIPDIANQECADFIDGIKDRLNKAPRSNSEFAEVRLNVMKNALKILPEFKNI